MARRFAPLMGPGRGRVHPLADGSKARRMGFHSPVDTRAMFNEIFDDLRRRRIIA